MTKMQHFFVGATWGEGVGDEQAPDIAHHGCSDFGVVSQNSQVTTTMSNARGACGRIRMGCGVCFLKWYIWRTQQMSLRRFSQLSTDDLVGVSPLVMRAKESVCWCSWVRCQR